MEITLFCSPCKSIAMQSHLNSDPSDIIGSHEIKQTAFEVDLNDDLHGIGICPHGHVTFVDVAAHRPDILYISAIKSFHRRCYSESILSFSSALERSHETFIKCFCIQNGSSMESVNGMWKEIQHQSERQYGAFCLAYYNTTKTHWEADQNFIKFRNNIVHKGKLATHKEAEEYAVYITEMIGKIGLAIFTHLRDSYKTFRLETQKERSPKTTTFLADARKKYPRDQFPNVVCCGTGALHLTDWNKFFNPRETTWTPITFPDALEKAKKEGWV